MAKKIKVIIKEPGKKPREARIEPTQAEIRKIICGSLRVFRIFEDGCVFCARDISNLDYNCEYLGRDFYGTVIWVGGREDNLCDFEEDLREFRLLNPSLFEEFERGERKKREELSHLCLFALFALGWCWITYELCDQIFSLPW